MSARSWSFSERAREAKADLVVFPELAIPGYPPEDLLLRTSFIDRNLAAWNEVARRVQGSSPWWGSSTGTGKGGHTTRRGSRRTAGPSACTGRCTCPNYGVFDEMRYFHKGTEPLLVPVGGTRVGITVCEDVWVPGGPVPREAREGAGLIINISSSPYHAGKWQIRRDLVASHAKQEPPAGRLLQHGGRAGRAGVRRREHGGRRVRAK